MSPKLTSPGVSVTVQDGPSGILTGTMTTDADGHLLIYCGIRKCWLPYPHPLAAHPMDPACQNSEMWGEIDEKYPDLQSLRDQYIKAAHENEELNRIRAEYDRLHEKYWIFEELKKPYEN